MKGSDIKMQYDKKFMDKMADDLEKYIEILDQYVIIDGITQEEYDEAMKTTRKLIKKLRKGEGDKVFNKERYRELLDSGKLDV